MMLSMINFMTPAMTTHKVRCINYKGVNDYNNDGEYVEARFISFTAAANVTAANEEETQFLANTFDATVSNRVYRVHINTGQQVYQERDTMQYAYMSAGNQLARCGLPEANCALDLVTARIAASRIIVPLEGIERSLRVLYADNRPHRHFCKALAVLEGLGNEKNR